MSSERTRPLDLLNKAAKFALLGGIGVPVVFLGIWQAIEALILDVGTKLDAIIWLHEFQLMFWPFSIVLLGSPEDEMNLGFLMIAVAGNILLYGIIGSVIALGERFPVLYLVAAVLVLIAWFAITSFWGSHFLSLAVSVALAGSISWVLFRRRKRM